MSGMMKALACGLTWVVATACSGGSGGTDNASSSSSGAGSSSSSSSSSSSGQACNALMAHSVLLYTGSDGGGPGSDIDVELNVKGPLQQSGLTVTVATTLPADFAQAYGVLFLMNPMQTLPAAVVDAAVALVQRGGQVVALMDHDAWGNAEAHNTFYTAVGSTLRFNVVGEGGTLPLVVHPFTGLTEGITSLSAFYSGSVTGGQAVGDINLTSPARTMTVVAAENVGCGRVVAVADVSIFGYSAAEGSNLAFLKKLGRVP